MTTRARVATANGYAGPPLDDLRLQAARLWVAQNRPYYAAALFRCAIVVTDAVPRLAVDESWRLYVNPAYANALSVTRLAAGLMHEVNHLLRDHAGRARAVGALGTAAHRRWNVAGDAEINDDLRDDGLDVDTISWVFPDDFACDDGLLAEQYYAVLSELEDGLDDIDIGHGHDGRDGGGAGGDGTAPVDNGITGWGCGSGSGADRFVAELPADDAAAPAVGDLEARLLRHQTANSVLEYHATHGTAPGALMRWARELLAPTVDWRRVLGGAVRHAVAVAAGLDDYSYRRFSRRQSAVPQVRLAGMLRRVPTVAVIIDTSGSMSVPQIAQAIGEVQGILRSASVADDSVTVLTVDTTVAAVVSATDARQIRTMHRGGTDMRVGIEAALRLPRRPDVLVVLTDGFTPWPDRAPRGVQMVVALVETRRNAATATSDVPGWARVVRIAIGDVGRRSVG